jgi:hypothetical protein
MPFTAEESSHEGHRQGLPDTRPRYNCRINLCIVLTLTALAGAMLGAVGVWWRTEKINVGYCGVGKSYWAAQSSTVPAWLRWAVAPQCEACPAHATCAVPFYAHCDEEYHLRESRASLWGLIPRPPRCEATTERTRQISGLARDIAREVHRKLSLWRCEPPTETTFEVIKHAIELRRSKAEATHIDGDIWPLALEEALQDNDIEICLGDDPVNVTLVATSMNSLCTTRRLLKQVYTFYAYAISVIVWFFPLRWPIFRWPQRHPAPNDVTVDVQDYRVQLRRSTRQRKPQHMQSSS